MSERTPPSDVSPRAARRRETARDFAVFLIVLLALNVTVWAICIYLQVS